MKVIRVAMIVRFLLMLLGIAACSLAWAQEPEPQPASDASAPLLTLDEAIQIATSQNREVKISALDVTKAKEEVTQTRTNYFPTLNTNVLAGSLLRPINFTVPAGTFGTYSATGPIPAKDSSIRSPARIGAFVYGSAAQPLTQIYKTRLAVRQARLSVDLSKEALRAQEQETRRQVKEAYYKVAQLQTQVTSANASVEALVELSKLTEQRLLHETVLSSDSLSVKAKVKQARYQLVVAEDALALQKRELNRVLGRDLVTAFSVETQPFGELAEWDLHTAQKQALDQRPELREAHLNVKIAEMDVRRERAKYIPDLSLSVNYMGFQNTNFLPQNIGTAGLLFQWQPFDWGFKKHRIAEFKANTQQKELAEQNSQQKVLLEVEDRFRKLREARILLQAQIDQRDAEQARMREVSDRYKVKASLLADVLQQTAEVSKADAEYQQALSGFWTARAEFEKAIGAQ
ncbi:MAG TPA: TolC family protein [Terriglobales bacterium]|nr:TolC family protein [Terriglobales bacterium]